MKKLISVLLSTATVFSLALLPVSATSIPEVESAAILEQPQLTNEDAHVLTMEMFNEAFTRDDVINILAADKANGMASTYAYVPVTVTEAEIQEFYAKIEAIVARAPALSYYFSNYYWWTRDDDDYYDDLISLKLVPTSVMKNTNDKEEALAAWALVKDACDSSRYCAISMVRLPIGPDCVKQSGIGILNLSAPIRVSSNLRSISATRTTDP